MGGVVGIRLYAIQTSNDEGHSRTLLVFLQTIPGIELETLHLVNSRYIMGCCSSRRNDSCDSSDGDSSRYEPLLKNGKVADCETSSNTTSWFEEEKTGPSGDEYPTWMKDEEARECFSCEVKFHAISERKHHCRRCRSIFCASCSVYKSKILSYAIDEDVRVCGACKMELKSENTYIKTQKPLLVRGENFVKYKMMGMNSHVVVLRMLVNDAKLVYSGQSKVEPEHIDLNAVKSIEMASLTCFEIRTQSKSYQFQADSTSTMNIWIEALRTAVLRAKEPSMRLRVDQERRKKKEDKTRAAHEKEQYDIAQSMKERRHQAMSNIKNKYGLR